MKSKFLPLRYTLLTYRLDQLWLPAGIWTLFVIITWLVQDNSSVNNVMAGFLGGALPLISGVLAAYTLLDDPTLELQFASPRPAWIVLVERLGLIFAIMAVTAVSYQLVVTALGLDLSFLGSPLYRQLLWLVPSIALIALGSASTLAMAQSMFGALLTGLMWIFQLILQGWFIHDAIARHFFLFIGIIAPGHPAQNSTYLTLTALAALLLAGAWGLLKKQERYI